MSTAKVAFNLANICSKYINALNKTSILQTKPFKGKLTPNTLGVVFPNGSIKFQSEKMAIKYINIRLQDALNRPAKKQFERVIVKKGTTIIGEGDGTHNECTEALLNIPGMFDQLITRKAKNLELYHSHPDIFGKGRTAPLSSPNGGDISAFRRFALKKIVAINSNGEFNSIERGQNFSNKNFHLFADGMDEYISKKVFGKLFGKLQKLLDKIEEYQSKNLKIPEELIKKRDITIGKMDKIEQTFRNSEKVEKFVHEYYQKANQFGMIYSTNFSNLI